MLVLSFSFSLSIRSFIYRGAVDGRDAREVACFHPLVEVHGGVAYDIRAYIEVLRKFLGALIVNVTVDVKREVYVKWFMREYQFRRNHKRTRINFLEDFLIGGEASIMVPCN